jgi:hypothetical protein
VSEPSADGVDVHTGEDQVAGRGVPDHVRGYRPASQPRDLGCTTLDEAVHAEAGERRPEPADEHGVFARATGNLVHQNALGFRP